MSQMGNLLPESKLPAWKHPCMIHIAASDPAERGKIESTLRREGFSVQTFPDGESFLEAASLAPPDVVFLGIALPGIGSLETISRASHLFPETSIILLSDQERAEFSFRAMRQGAHDVILEPYPQSRLTASIENAMRVKGLERELKRLRSELRDRHDFKNIIGISPAVCKMIEEIQRLEDGEGPVLFLGEHGTGKELAARALHYNSRLADEPFFSINCTVLRKERSFAEVFSSLRGNPSRRDRDFNGMRGGTLFLDEVGEMDPALLIELSNRLDAFGRMRVDDSVPPVHMRIFFSLRTDRQGVAAALVRDSLDRFSANEVRVPPLRARTGDIEPLAKHFIAENMREDRPGPSGVSEEAMKVLRAYGWPGNVRELKNVLRQAALMSESGRIEASDLPPSIRAADLSDAAEGRSANHGSGTLAREHHKNGVATPPLTLEETERRLIQETLEFTKGNISRTAAMLEISRSALYRRIEKLHISRI